MTALPDAEQLLTTLTAQLQAEVTPTTGLIGIRTGGVWVAERLHAALKLAVPPGVLDISFYRDDFGAQGLKHAVQPSTIPFAIEERDLILVDDVLYTGRTARAALDALFDHGRPRRIQLCVLIDRGHRELPIEATFVGRTIQTTANEIIEVRLQESDGADKVLLLELAPEEP